MAAKLFTARREVERAARVGRAVEARRVARPRRCVVGEGAGGDRSARCAGARCSRPKPSSVSTGGSARVAGAGDALAQRDDAAQHVDEEAGDRRGSTIPGSAVVWTSTSQPLPRFSAVTSGVPSVSRAQVLPARSSVGSASTWRETVTSSGMARPAKGLSASKRRELRRLSPRTARRPACGRRGAASPAADRRPSARRDAGPAKRSTHAAVLHPFDQRALLARRRPARASGSAQHRDVAA